LRQLAGLSPEDIAAAAHMVVGEKIEIPQHVVSFAEKARTFA
jgi:hypothetical protein